VTASGEELARLDPRDREYVDSLERDEREVVVSTILRHQRESRIASGDRLPALSLHRLEDGARVQLRDLVDGRPLVLVFGSFT